MKGGLFLPQFTRNAIIESFIRLATRNPLEKITVKDIVDACGVNRNTFYYYFQDMYALVEDLFHAGPAASDPGKVADTWTEGFVRLARFTQLYPRAVRNIYTSVGYDVFEGYVDDVIGEPIFAALKRESEKMGCPDIDLNLPALFYRQALMGIYSLWLRHDMKDDPERMALQLMEVHEGTMQMTLSNCWKTVKR
ncbi:putative dihydroxyacetone kinase regulator [Clostridium sp. CAG:448]|nr:putative dihydroxyacetone kinase regulator [Clostridium sp. CAG:448]